MFNISHIVFINITGNSSKKDGFEKKDIDAPQITRPSQSAFLGPQIWDKTLPYDLMDNDFKDFKLEYMDLNEFFSVSLLDYLF